MCVCACVCVTSVYVRHMCIYACVREYKNQEIENHENGRATVGNLSPTCKQEVKRTKKRVRRISLSIYKLKEHPLADILAKPSGITHKHIRCHFSFFIWLRWKLFGIVLRWEMQFSSHKAMLFYFEKSNAVDCRRRSRTTREYILNIDIKRSVNKISAFLRKSLEEPGRSAALSWVRTRQVWRGLIRVIYKDTEDVKLNWFDLYLQIETCMAFVFMCVSNFQCSVFVPFSFSSCHQYS